MASLQANAVDAEGGGGVTPTTPQGIFATGRPAITLGLEAAANAVDRIGATEARAAEMTALRGAGHRLPGGMDYLLAVP